MAFIRPNYLAFTFGVERFGLGYPEPLQLHLNAGGTGGTMFFLQRTGKLNPEP